MARCEVCFRHCELSEGQTGFCGARVCRGEAVTSDNYGKLTAAALDPIEKKPLRRFLPGSRILSVGSYGCNLRCPFCQNNDISWGERAFSGRKTYLSPEGLAEMAVSCKDKGNVGVAFTYNEPLIGWEYVRDTAKLVHKAGMVNVLVSNGTAELWVLEEILPYIDAMNIDLKSFDRDVYRKTLGGDLDTVLHFIERASQSCHIELTTLIVPGMNDSEEEMRKISEWTASLRDDIPLHISRFFPQFHMTDRPPTDVSQIYGLAETARERLRFVYTGNC